MRYKSEVNSVLFLNLHETNDSRAGLNIKQNKQTRTYGIRRKRAPQKKPRLNIFSELISM